VDILQKLRACRGIQADDPDCNCAEAADEIERLRAALEKIANRFEDAKSPYTIEGQTREEARAALKSK
jgi:dihydropteroate synthase